jgi:hypothetical protein
MQIKSVLDRNGFLQRFIDSATSETVARFQPCILDEDFIGAGHSAIPAGGAPAVGYPWVKKTQQTTGVPAVAVVANSAGGTVRNSLDATSEKQEATIYANDQLNWDVTKGLFFETRLSHHVLASAAQVEMAWGLSTAWIDGPDNAARYLRFQSLGSGVVNIQSKDGTNTLSFATPISMVVDVFHVFTIDATDPTNVVFYIDGAQVSLPNQLSFAATGANAILQPMVTAYKASGVGVGSIDIDTVQAAMNRQ